MPSSVTYMALSNGVACHKQDGLFDMCVENAILVLFFQFNDLKNGSVERKYL